LAAAPEAPAAFDLTTNPVDPGTSEAALRSAYEGLTPDPGLWDSIKDSLVRAVGWLIDVIGRFLAGGSGAGRLVAWTAAVALTVVLAWAGVWLLRRVGLVKESSAATGDRSAPPVDWQAAADGALARGDLVEATRALYRQLLATLARKGWITDRPGLTAGDCRRAARRIPGLYPDIAMATLAFEKVAYGKRYAEPEDVEALRRAESLVAAAPAAPAPPGGVAA
jgi:hypothetical protein